MSNDTTASPSRDINMLTASFSAVVKEKLKSLVQYWECIYGTNSEYVTRETEELGKLFEEFWGRQISRIHEVEINYINKIDGAGKEATSLEKVLGLEPQIQHIPHHGPLVEVNEKLQTLLETYKQMKRDRMKEYASLKEKEEELCIVFEMIPIEPADGVPSTSYIIQLQERIRELEKKQDQLHYDFEVAKTKLQSLLDDCGILPLTKEERFAYDNEEMEVTIGNLKLLQSTVGKYYQIKQKMIRNADQLRVEISQLHRKLFKNPTELDDFLAENDGYKECTITKLKEKLEELKQERKEKLKELIAKCRENISDLWDKCCYSQAQRDEFKPFTTTWRIEEVLEIHEMEIEKLEIYYHKHRKIFELAKEHEKLWNQLLFLEEQANNKERLFDNRGGCLLKEEKERKSLQKKLPLIRSQLVELSDAHKEETGEDFLLYGEPLLYIIEQKEYNREVAIKKNRNLRKEINTETTKLESRLGARPAVGMKRKAVTNQDSRHMKTLKVETLSSASSSKSTVSSKSTASSANMGTLVRRQATQPSPYGQSSSRCPNYFPQVNFVVHRPSPICKKQVPTASTPQNGSLSYESFQEHIEKSNYVTHNSTRKVEKQGVLGADDVNEIRAVERATPYRMPKTSNRTITKTPSQQTPSKTPFKIPTGSKIPSQVPPISPNKKPTLTTTKLPFIF